MLFFPYFFADRKRISGSFDSFSDSEDVKNGIKAARWCFDHQLYQQCATLLRESIDTLTCISASKVCPEINYRKEKWRECAANCYYNIANNKLAKDGSFPLDSEAKKAMKNATPAEEEQIKNKCKEKFIPFIEEMMNQDFWKNIDINELESFKSIRNDINHCGMRNSPADAETVKDKTKSYLEYLEKFVNEELG